jgi:hypothetical protein
MAEDQERQPESLLPYDEWVQAAMRQVVARALAHVAANGLPGEHHFYVTFRTDHASVALPDWLRSQYPETMRIHLARNYADLRVDAEAAQFSVSLSFSGVASTLVVPFASVTEFVDPFIGLALQFRATEPAAPATEPAPADAAPAEPQEAPQVVSLDAFRRRSPPKP